jgi:hypothetical protein
VVVEVEVENKEVEVQFVGSRTFVVVLHQQKRQKQ